AWNDFGTPHQLLSIVGNANAAALMHHPAVVTREGLPAFTGPAAGGPTNLAAIVTGTSVAFSWSPPPGGAAGGYLLEAAASAGGAAIATLPVAQAAVTVTGVPVGTYYVRVRAVGGVLASNEVTVTIGGAGPSPCGAPAAPAGLVASVSGGLVTLGWTTGGGCAAASYRLQAGSAPGLTDLASLGVAGTSVTVSAPPGQYYVRVVAVNASGASGASNEVLVNVP
ncbi:MAG: hypothetical protein AB7V01_20520, partial [Vicinamibacterales bacterium]